MTRPPRSRRMGRSARGPRTVLCSVRWTPSEWRAIRFEAGRRGVRPASYIRRATLGDVSFVPRSPRARRQRFSTPRSETLKVRLHPDELARIRRLAETLSMPVSTFVRDAAVGYSVSSRADSETIRHLAWIGNNLNQLTRYAHESKRLETEDELAALLHRLREILDTLL